MRGPLFLVRMRRWPKSLLVQWYRVVESTGKCEGQLEKKQWHPLFVWMWTIAQADWCWCLSSAVSSLFIFVVGYIGWSSSESRSTTSKYNLVLSLTVTKTITMLTIWVYCLCECLYWPQSIWYLFYSFLVTSFRTLKVIFWLAVCTSVYIHFYVSVSIRKRNIEHCGTMNSIRTVVHSLLCPTPFEGYTLHSEKPERPFGKQKVIF